MIGAPNVLETVENCRYCLMCRHLCPVGHVTRKETLTPHGWALMIASVKRGLLAWNEDVVSALYACADCGLCRSHCVTGQPLPSAIAAARAEVVAQRLAPPVVYEVGEKLRAWQNPFEPRMPEPVEGRGEVALFVGDGVTYLRPQMLRAALLLLAAVGVQPVLIAKGRSNGYLASTLGLHDIAIDLARANLDDLAAAGATRLLVMTPGDSFVFTRLYPERLGLTLPEGVECLGMIPFLLRCWQEGGLAFRRETESQPYAYVESTHAVRVAGWTDAARQLVHAFLPDSTQRELFWRRERAHTGGDTGLRFTNQHIATHLAYSRLGDAVDAGAQLLITEDATSLHQLEQHARRFGVRVEGLYELASASLRTS